MRVLRSSFCFVALLATSTVVCADARDQRYGELKKLADDYERGSTSKLFRNVIELVEPAVVHVQALTKLSEVQRERQEEMWKRLFPDMDRDQRERRQENVEVPSSGSGLIIDARKYKAPTTHSYIITNNHVVEGATADKITVVLSDDREYTASDVWTDPETDMAVIQVKATNLPAIRFGDSGKLLVGDWVFAFGAPFGGGFRQTVTHGIVSFNGRSNVFSDNRKMPYQRFIQTDAAVNRGNSGGPLINIRGEVVGINTLIFSTSGGAQGISLAIPSETVEWIVPQLIENHRVRKGYLGTGIETFNPDLKERYAEQSENRRIPPAARRQRAEMARTKAEKGAYISAVAPNGPAAKGGLRKGDVVVSLDGERILTSEELVHAIGRKKVDSKVKVEYWRGGSKQVAQVVLAERTQQSLASLEERSQRSFSKELLGLTIEKLDDETRKKLELDEGQGVKVKAVADKSAAQKAKVAAGDVIVQVNYENVGTPQEFEARLAAVQREAEDAPITLRVYRLVDGKLDKKWRVIQR